MKICMMSLMMTSVFTSDYPVERILDTAAACGMGAVDWVGLHGTAAAVLKRASEAAGIPVAAHTMLKEGFIQGRPDYLDEFKSSLEDAVTLGAPVLMLPPFARKNRQSAADDRSRYIDYFGAAEELARKAGITLTLESTGYEDSPVTTAAECLEILRAVPGLRVTFDVGNVFTAEDPLAAFRQLRQYVVHFHFKDWLVSPEPKPGFHRRRNGCYMTETMIGDGVVPLAELWREFTPAERELWINPESCDFTDTMPPETAFAEICRRMREEVGRCAASVR